MEYLLSRSLITCCVAAILIADASGQTPTDRQLTGAEQSRLSEAERLNTTVGKLYGQKKYAEATRFALRVLKIREDVLGPDHAATGTSLNDVGVLFYEQGDYVDAQPYFQRALMISEKSLGADHRDTVLSLYTLAQTLNLQRKHDEAKPLLSCFCASLD